MRPFVLTHQDLCEARAAFRPNPSAQQPSSFRARVVGWVLFISLAVLLVTVIRNSQSDRGQPPPIHFGLQERVALACLALGTGLFVFIFFGVFRWYRMAESHSPANISFDEEGISWDTPGTVATWKWIAFREIRQTRNLIVLVTPGGHLQLVPRIAFDSPVEESAFIQRATERIAARETRADAH